MGEVQIKPLEWSRVGTEWEKWGKFSAGTEQGQYSVEWRQNKDFKFFYVSYREDRDIDVSTHTLDGAKAAAQADYEARIRSALLPDVSGMAKPMGDTTICCGVCDPPCDELRYAAPETDSVATPPASDLREENARLRKALEKVPNIVVQWAGTYRLQAEEYTALALGKHVYPEVKAVCDAALQTEGK